MGVPPAPKSSFRRKFCGCLFQIPEHAPKLYSDKAFDFIDWQWHQNAAWRHRLEPFVFFVVASGFVWQLAHVFMISIFCGLYHIYLVPMGWPNFSSQLNSAFGMVTTCLSLLLVFRTNSSYSRWWEARIVWGSVVNLSRNYARQMMIWAPPERTHIARMGARWMAVAVHVMRAHLRAKHTGRVTQEAGHLLTLDEFAWLAQWRSAPQGAAHVLSWAAANLGVHYQREQVLQELVNTFINDLGMCERILRTPMPTAYTSHTSRFVLIYITIAPVLLWNVLQWATPVCSVMIAFLLLGTENIGVQIEEPFKVLPLDSICNTIENSIRDMEKRHYGSCSMDELRQVDASKLACTYDEDAVHARYAEEGAVANQRMEELFAGTVTPLMDPSALETMHPPRSKPPIPVFARTSSHRAGSGGGKPPAPAAADVSPPGQAHASRAGSLAAGGLQRAPGAGANGVSPFEVHAGRESGAPPSKPASAEPSAHSEHVPLMAQDHSHSHGGALHSDSLYANHNRVSFGMQPAMPMAAPRPVSQPQRPAASLHVGAGGWTSQELLANVGVSIQSPPNGPGSGASNSQHMVPAPLQQLPQTIGKLIKTFTRSRGNANDPDPVVWDDEAPAVPDSPSSRSAHFHEAMSHTRPWNPDEVTMYGSGDRSHRAAARSAHDRSVHDRSPAVEAAPVPEEAEEGEEDETQAMLGGQERSGRSKAA
eukprot:CAMPEP_0202885580 /NCGR_PEP_ID=MMETSP1391-20130828/41735_1 /ASSEMBLY_ACC=CAM_ASM_000867 /TAXON_ID=1034604 /ORGANISM="Chlamydomonas leiostraca, Strain SAG 11-49" /LENGTH=705 /DNA_ID=CAMNT_0049568831 /DNA_START=42 /DNA_END=2159 /DNA_ORIENTATION=+